MIECKAKNKKTYYHPNNGWLPLDPGVLPCPSDFRTLVFRINGVVYSDWDEEVEGIIAWERLKR